MNSRTTDLAFSQSVSAEEKAARRWTAYTWENGKQVYFGRFDTELQAAEARNRFDISQGRQPSNVIPQTPEWSTPVIEEITMAQWEEMQRGPGEWVPVQNECHHD
jgi:hypothetical protein